MGLYCLIEPQRYDEEKLVDAVKKLRAEAFAEVERHYKDWKDNERRVRLDVWNVEPEDQDRFHMAFPETTNILRRVSAMILDRTPKVIAYPANLHTTSEAAKTMSELFSALWALEGYKAEIRRLVYQAMTYGVSVAYVAWDGAKGYPVIRTILPYDIAPAPGATVLDEASYVVRRQQLRGFELVRRFGIEPAQLRDLTKTSRETAGTEKADVYPVTDLISVDYGTSTTRPSGIASVSKTSLSAGQGGRRGGGTSSSEIEDLLDEVFEVTEIWVRKNPQEWNRFFVSGEKVLYSSFEEIFRYCEYRWCEQPKPSWVGLSLVELLSYLQRFVNTQFTSIATHTERTGDPIEAMTADVADLQNHSYALEGRRVILPPGTPPGGGIWWIQPPALAPDVMASINLALQAMARVPGIDMLGAEDEQKTRRSATEMSQLAQRRHMVLRGDAEVLENFLKRLATIVMNVLAAHQTEELRIPSPAYLYSGEDVQVPPDAFKTTTVDASGNVVEIPMRFSAVVDLGATLGVPKDQLTQLGFELYDRGIIDAKALFEVFLDMPGGDALVVQAQQRQQAAVDAIRGSNAQVRRDNQQDTEGGAGAQDRFLPQLGQPG